MSCFRNHPFHLGWKYHVICEAAQYEPEYQLLRSQEFIWMTYLSFPYYINTSSIAKEIIILGGPSNEEFHWLFNSIDSKKIKIYLVLGIPENKLQPFWRGPVGCFGPSWKLGVKKIKHKKVDNQLLSGPKDLKT